MSFLKAAIVENSKFLRNGLRVLPNIFIRCKPDFERAKGTAQTMNEIKAKMMDRLGLDTGFVLKPKSRDHLLQYEPKLKDLPLRSMQNSFTSAIIPLSRSRNLQDKYVTVLGHVRLGRLMEDMDIFAVWVCHQHLKIPTLDPSVPLPYTFVTLLVDKIDFTDFTPQAALDIRLSGHVSWVGTSSMEIVVWLEQIHEGKYKKITRALFLMAARNATNTKAAPVNPLQPANDHEQVILSGGESRKERRKKLREMSLLKVEPNTEEQKLMHDLFIRTTETDTMALNCRKLPPNARWMGDTSVVSTMPSFPENRNAQNTVFGGFLMRNALEISWVCATLFIGNRAKLMTICDIRFQKPVDVSSFLRMTSHVVFAKKNYVQIMTLADTLDWKTGKQATSNLFSHTYKASDMDTVAEVLPRSYDETLWYIEGRRKFINDEKLK